MPQEKEEKGKDSPLQPTPQDHRNHDSPANGQPQTPPSSPATGTSDTPKLIPDTYSPTGPFGPCGYGC